jgi:predicted AlkP superfamily pyrophosphatase or phosphodiesterase
MLWSRSVSERPAWFPESVWEAKQVVLFVVDGLGWEQVLRYKDSLKTISTGQGTKITSVAPTTTAVALTSLTTGFSPTIHGLMGYRLSVGTDEVLNVLHWRINGKDARSTLPPYSFQPIPAFRGSKVPVVVKSGFPSSGFTSAHLQGAVFHTWQMPSVIGVEVSELLSKGETFIYVYYDGIDKVAHEWGLDSHYKAELKACDGIVEELIERLPKGCALVLTSDHGQVQVDQPVIVPDSNIMDMVSFISGEGRFRWLHANQGAQKQLLEYTTDLFSDVAWVMSRDELVQSEWFGKQASKQFVERLGDVALVSHEPVAFMDPGDIREMQLLARHGSLTAAEMWVPLLSWFAE